MNYPSVAIIIINWNNFEDSKKCLISLQACTYPNFLTIVVDNGSTDGSGNQLKNDFGNFAQFIFSPKNLGFSGGNNLGIRYALDNDFDYVMELNNDTEVTPEFLTYLINSIHDKPQYGAAQPLIFFNGENRNKIWNAGGTLIKPLGISVTRMVNKFKPKNFVGSETDWITGCAFLIKSDVIKKTGLMREFYFFGSFEDVDMSIRIKDLGYKLWMEPTSEIYHSVGNSSKSKKKGKEGYLNPIVHYLYQRNQIIFIKHHTPKLFIPFAIFVQFLKMIPFSIYFLLRNRKIKLKNRWRGFKDGLIKTYND